MSLFEREELIPPTPHSFHLISFNQQLSEPEQLLPGFGLCIDGRDWSLAYVQEGSVAGRLGILRGSSVVKCQGESVQRRHVRSFFNSLRDATDLSLAVLRTADDGKITGFNVVMKVADIAPNRDMSEAASIEGQGLSAAGRLPVSALRGPNEPDGHREEGGHMVGTSAGEEVPTNRDTRDAEGGGVQGEKDFISGSLALGDCETTKNQMDTPRDQIMTRPKSYTPPAGTNVDELWQGDTLGEKGSGHSKGMGGMSTANEIVGDARSAARGLVLRGSPLRGRATNDDATAGTFEGPPSGESGGGGGGGGGASGGVGGGGRDGISAAMDTIVAKIKGGSGKAEGSRVGTPEWPAPLDAESNLAHSNSMPIAVQSKCKRKKEGKAAGKKKSTGTTLPACDVDECVLRARLEKAEREREQQRAVIQTLQARLMQEDDRGDHETGAHRGDDSPHDSACSPHVGDHASHEPVGSPGQSKVCNEGIENMTSSAKMEELLRGALAAMDKHRGMLWSIMGYSISPDSLTMLQGDEVGDAEGHLGVLARQLEDKTTSLTELVRQFESETAEMLRLKGSNGVYEEKENAHALFAGAKDGKESSGIISSPSLQLGRMDSSMCEALSESETLLEEAVWLRGRVCQLEDKTASLTEQLKLAGGQTPTGEWQDCGEEDEQGDPFVSSYMRESGASRSLSAGTQMRIKLPARQLSLENAGMEIDAVAQNIGGTIAKASAAQATVATCDAETSTDWEENDAVEGKGWRVEADGGNAGTGEEDARVGKLERQNDELRSMCAALEQQRDRAMADCMMQTEAAKNWEERASAVEGEMERERLVLAEELEGAKGSLWEERQLGESLKTELEIARRERADALKEAGAEKERAERLRKDLAGARVTPQTGEHSSKESSPLSTATTAAAGGGGRREESRGSRGERENKPRSGGSRHAAGGSGKRELSEDELLGLLNKAWEDGKEAAEKRLEFEKKQMEAQWKAIKSEKKSESVTKKMFKAVVERKVW